MRPGVRGYGGLYLYRELVLTPSGAADTPPCRRMVIVAVTTDRLINILKVEKTFNESEEGNRG